MQISPIDALYNQQATAPAPEELDRDAFMQLLVSQLQNQDPLEPVQNEDFVAQLATFSSLEQLEGINDGMTGLLLTEQAGQITSELSQGASLIGKQVGWTDPSTGIAGEGTVDSVKVVDDLTTVTVGGENIPIYWLDLVTPGDPGADPVDPSSEEDDGAADGASGEDSESDEQA